LKMNEVELELSEAMIKDLVSIGLEVILNSYFTNLKKLAEDAGEEWDDERINIIGQNGNNGDHYE